MSNNSRTDPCAWLGRVAAVLPAGRVKVSEGVQKRAYSEYGVVAQSEIIE